MVEPEKPFACGAPDCGMTFTNEDHLNVHTKKHDMALQLGMEQKAVFVADQTPTPTRFMRVCEEVELFLDLTVNPFDEGFKKAMETKACIQPIDSTPTASEELHTPQMVFPQDSTLYSTTNNKNITISRSSSDESGAIKEFETTTISKLTNEVTTISRIVGKSEEKADNTKNDLRKDSVSYTNNVIKISNMVRKDSVENQTNCHKDTTQNTLEVPPIMSQKSLDFIVDSLTTDFDENKKKNRQNDEDYEVTIRLPNGKQVKMRPVDEVPEKNAKEVLKKVLTEKSEVKNNLQRLNSVVLPVVSNVVPSVVPLATGTLIPVTIVNSVVQKVPIAKETVFDKRPVKRKVARNETAGSSKSEKTVEDLDSRCAASRRYRARLKQTYDRQSQENKQLKELNERLLAERAVLNSVITEHVNRCPNSNDLRSIMEKLKNGSSL
ncbi:activating transcription factor-2 [Anticarsia gemmatalis]|uniref:activating transcription factor-2 n=1 Tax=Anticarsia gemmatalis TaxID=129554 RepID=UPI003F75B23F